MTNREILNDLDYDHLLIFENPDYDDAMIGVSHDERVIYDYDKMVAHLMREDGMTMEEAMEFIDFNTLRSLPYFEPGAPIIMYGLPHWIEHCS